jgi:hypothetical protein
VKIKDWENYSRRATKWGKRRIAREYFEIRDAERERNQIKRAREEAERKEYEAKAHELFMQTEEGKQEQERLRWEQERAAEAKRETDMAYMEWQRIYSYGRYRYSPTFESWWTKKNWEEAREAERKKAAAEAKERAERQREEKERERSKVWLGRTDDTDDIDGDIYLPTGQSREEKFSSAAQAAMGQQEVPVPELQRSVSKPCALTCAHSGLYTEDHA